MQISCRPYRARAHTNKRFRFAASDGAARAELRAVRPVGCICGLGSSGRDVAAISPKAGHEPRTDPCRIVRVAWQRLHEDPFLQYKAHGEQPDRNERYANPQRRA